MLLLIFVSLIFVMLTSKDIPGVIVPIETLAFALFVVSKMIEFSVTAVVRTVANVLLSPAIMAAEVGAVKVPTAEAPAARTLAGFPIRIFAGRREP